MVTSLQVNNKNHQIPWKIDIYAYYSIDNWKTEYLQSLMAGWTYKLYQVLHPIAEIL